MSVPPIERRWLLLAAGALLAPPFVSSCQGQTPAPATVAAVPPQAQPQPQPASDALPDLPDASAPGVRPGTLPLGAA
jgi:hypothetical protein